MSAVLELTEDLVRRPSVTPQDEGCQALLIARLAALGFDITELNFGSVSNFWARKGTAAPLLVFAGHTDVVPTGPAADWRYPPFQPTRSHGELFGRGTADMKGSLAAMIIATERFLAQNPAPAGSIGFLVTSDEEGPALDGTRRVVEYLRDAGVDIDYCLVGEPSSSKRLGDFVRNGRRGSLNGTLRVRGSQGHVAYPDLADNPIHSCLAALDRLCRRTWDNGNDYFPATSFQISNINAGTGASNVIPGELLAKFNFRFCSDQTPDGLRSAVATELADAGLDFELDWEDPGMPFLTEHGDFTELVAASIEAITGARPTLSTSGGTSDGRFIAPTGASVIELGPINATIHKVDERVSIADLDQLADIFRDLLQRTLTT